MNQQVLWNNMVFNPAEVESMTDRIASSSDANLPCLGNQDGGQLSIWGSSGSSSSQHYQHDGLEENKWDYGWTPSGTSTSRSGLRIEENHFEGSHMLSLESHSTTQIDVSRSFLQNDSLFNNMHHNTEHAAVRVGIGNELSDSRLSHHSYALGFLDSESVPSSVDLSVSSDHAENVGLLREDDERLESSIDGRRISCKRKNSEGFNGQPSTSANASSSHQSETSLLHSHSHSPMTSFNISNSGYPSLPHSTEEVPTTFGNIIRGVASECYPSASTVGNAESSRRNYRMRTNPSMPQPSSWSVNTVRQSDVWSPNQLPSRTIPLNHSLDPTPLLTSTSSQNQPHMPLAPGLPHIIYHFPWNGASSSRIGSSSGPFGLEDRVIAARGGNQSRNMPMAGNLDLVPATSIRNRSQDQANWNLGSRNVSMVPSSQTGTNTGLHPTLGSSWLPHQTPTQYPQPLPESVHPSLFPSVSSETGGQSGNFRRQNVGHSFSSQEVAHPIRPTLRGTQPTSQIRSANLMRRRNDGILSAPLTMRSLTSLGEERSRMLSEIRHALESLRRADGLRFEDVFILDQTLILAGSDLHDRHRDMRLDVDNMSYEELLALEERIGDVCTGLSEEIILKCLKQRKHSSTIFGASIEHEPCCVCQEGYAEGEDVGTLDCGHDFHTACIKQWLTHKNLCPICKNTALQT